MPSTTVYSFADVNMTFSHPSYPAFVMSGQGLGDISISYTQDQSAHNLSADGSTMITKIRANNGQISVSMQQTSTLHNWLKGLFNFLNNAPAALWALGQITITSPNAENIVLSNVCFLKRADQPFQQQGQMVTWNFLFSNGVNAGTVVNTALNVTANIQNLI